MGNIKTKELTRLGYKDNLAKSMIVQIVVRHCKHVSNEEILSTLVDIQNQPEKFRQNAVWRPLIDLLRPIEPEVHLYDLLPQPIAYRVYGEEEIEPLARQQIEMAMRLPVTVGGALMPDGHAGYGLPIGGVLATEGVVIPYAVGLDIACRMSLTLLDADASFIDRYHDLCVSALQRNTAFGINAQMPVAQYHPVFDKPEFKEIPLLKGFREKAIRQLGSSGKGNHFVDICEVVLKGGNALGLPQGSYVGLLSHSGSRGLGAKIAEHFTSIAKSTCRLPVEAGAFAWLDLKTEAGEEYWRCMTIAGEYSEANHERIHGNVMEALGLRPLASVSNHHNFAWKEILCGGREVIVHRKGAMPAHLGELGLIPGSMASPGYLVSGLAHADSLCSASHGAGRAMSRQEARNTFSRHALRKYLAERNVTLIGGSTEEAPLAYKDIDHVMASQQELVRIEGTVIPRVVRMAEEE